ncbi:Hypp9160 [Branchiostoma lanceolatum]|uniref:Hypp9160 protein n=1 Tax=Branchiostoma lanceolatum TaxID=7740 RepID=A0A8J9ZD96_BRALA|nr:Hypp9160 [Branchiostoma lanceolatum]
MSQSSTVETAPGVGCGGDSPRGWGVRETAPGGGVCGRQPRGAGCVGDSPGGRGVRETAPGGGVCGRQPRGRNALETAPGGGVCGRQPRGAGCAECRRAPADNTSRRVPPAARPRQTRGEARANETAGFDRGPGASWERPRGDMRSWSVDNETKKQYTGSPYQSPRNGAFSHTGFPYHSSKQLQDFSMRALDSYRISPSEPQIERF